LQKASFDISSKPEWASHAVGELETRIRSPDFPCYFASHAEIIWEFVDEAFQTADLWPVFHSIIKYLEKINEIDQERERAFCVLAIAFRPSDSPLTIDIYKSGFWRVLQFLHDHDPSPWPPGIPLDPNNPNWSFCFAATPLFMSANSPAHRCRRSRNLGKSMVLVVQPRSGIDYAAPPNNIGDRVRQSIRARINSYDAVRASKDLATHGSPNNRDWKLYFLSDATIEGPWRCPLRLTQKQPSSVKVKGT